MSGARIRQNGAAVQLIVNGRVEEMPWEAALQLAAALQQVGRLAESYAKANSIVADGAILLRAGAPFGITDDAKMKREIAKEAAWSTRLRRYMPGGVKSAEQFGTPTIIQYPARTKA